jgi:hypothetical protein
MVSADEATPASSSDVKRAPVRLVDPLPFCIALPLYVAADGTKLSVFWCKSRANKCVNLKDLFNIR